MLKDLWEAGEEVLCVGELAPLSELRAGMGLVLLGTSGVLAEALRASPRAAMVGGGGPGDLR